jgi:hypothetical protein
MRSLKHGRAVEEVGRSQLSVPKIERWRRAATHPITSLIAKLMFDLAQGKGGKATWIARDFLPVPSKIRLRNPQSP